MGRQVSAAAVIPAIDVEKLTVGVPRGAWVAISVVHDRRVAVGESVDDVISKSEAAGETEPLVVRVPETAAALIL